MESPEQKKPDADLLFQKLILGAQLVCIAFGLGWQIVILPIVERRVEQIETFFQRKANEA